MPDLLLWDVHCLEILPIVLHLLQLVHPGYVEQLPLLLVHVTVDRSSEAMHHQAQH